MKEDSHIVRYGGLGRFGEFSYKVRDPEGKVGELIWSDIAPNGMSPTERSQIDSIKYCSHLDARLPTKEEYEALKRAMTQNEIYNPDLLEMNGRLFWTSSTDSNGSNKGAFFNSIDGKIKDASNTYALSVRCVYRQNIFPILPWDEIRAFIPTAFLNLNPISKVRDPGGQIEELIWSNVAPNTEMSRTQAIGFCKEIGGRLPTQEEYEAVKRAMTQSKYNNYALPGMSGYYFWTSSLSAKFADTPMIVNGDYGLIHPGDYSDRAVQCVIPVSELERIGSLVKIERNAVNPHSTEQVETTHTSRLDREQREQELREIELAADREKAHKEVLLKAKIK